MSILEKLSRQTIRIGSSDACEICLQGPGVAPVHAEIIHQGSGKLVFLPGAAGASTLEGRLLAPGMALPFDFRNIFFVGEVSVPVTHFDLCAMVMSRGLKEPQKNELVVGRDPERCHLVMSSPGVSGRHLTIQWSDSPSIIDHSSTSGTWFQGQRLPPEESKSISNDAILSLGPLPLPLPLAREILSALNVPQETFRPVAETQVMPRRTVARRSSSRMAAPPGSRAQAKHRTVMGTIKMVGTKSHTIGRTPDNDIVLDYAQISGHHAKLTSIGPQLFIEDMGSELGTSVRGTRLKRGQKARVADGARMLFGPMPALLKCTDDSVELIVEDREGWAGRPLFSVTASHLSVQVEDRDNSSKQKTLLEDVSFKALPGDLVALMGPSGSGKTTLLHALTGYTQPSKGKVLINDIELPQIFDSLRGSIGYVPQDDIIHPELKVREAVHYSARFRLPSDYSDDEIDRRVTRTLSQLGLDSVAHLQIGKPEHKILSGGQRKRVNIAMELVTDPVLLFLDEPTSGLAADDTTALVDLLARLASESGKTIIATIHQPARDEYEKFNLALILGHGGVPLYFGPTEDAYEFFEAWRGPQETRGIDTPRDMFAELAEREVRVQEKLPHATRQQLREAVSNAYKHEYNGGAVEASMVQEGRKISSAQTLSPHVQDRVRPRGQLRLLVSRYLTIKLRDRVGSAILLLQAPIIAILLSLVFGARKPSPPYWCLGALNQLSQGSEKMAGTSGNILASMQPVPDQSGAIFFLVVAAIWFGTSNAAREIVSEKAIYRRERMVNLGVVNYTLSKFFVLAGLCLIQCAILLSIVFYSLGLAGGVLGYFSALGILVATSLCSVALGLLLSTIVSSSEAAMALTPIALIPQIVLGGLMVPITTNPLLRIPMNLMPSRWAFEGVVRLERLAVSDASGWNMPLEGIRDSPPDFIKEGIFQCALAQLKSTQLSGAWGFSSAAWLPPSVLALMTLAILFVVMNLLRRKV